MDEDKMVDALTDIQEEEAPQLPQRGSPEWTDYVLSLLKDGVELFTEKQGKKELKLPCGHGLRRVFPQVIGPIIDNKITAVQCPRFTGHTVKDSKGKTIHIYDVAVSQCELVYRDLQDGIIKTQIEIASVSPDNCQPPFLFHGPETAGSKAESRAFKKAMYLNCSTREEISEGTSYYEDGTVSATEITVLGTLCQRASVDYQKFIKKYAEDYASTKRQYEMPKAVFAELRNIVQDWLDNKSSKVPEELR